MKRNNRGFTLMELMVVVSILGILAAVAVPSFLKYIMRSKTSEATINIRKVYDGSVAYFQTDRYNAAGAFITHQFPTSTNPLPLPSALKATKVAVPPTSWEAIPTWVGLNFALEDPGYFAYQYVSNGLSSNASVFTGYAFGNLDGDATFSTFARVGHVNQGEILGGAHLLKVNEID